MNWTKALNEYVWDEKGKKYIDFTSGGIFTCSVGNANKRVMKAIREVPFIASYEHGNPYKERYLEMLAEFTGYEAAALFSAGTEATEAAWRIMRRNIGKEGIVGLPDAFHGMTLGALIMASLVNDWRYAEVPEKTCGIIIEPYIALTAQQQSNDLINKVISYRNEFSLMLCLDEVQGGFGRTGKLFGYEHYDGLKPDLVCIGKACGSGFPLSAVLGRKELINEPEMELHSTHGGNPLACAVGIATIEEFIEKDLVNRAGHLGETILEPWIGTLPVEAYGRGMIAGMVFDDRETCKKVIDLCEKRGLIVVDTKKHVIKIGPPLIIKETVLRRGLKILRESIEEVLDESTT
jgi:4-aminobutyrate aminotransferase-like enzyme